MKENKEDAPQTPKLDELIRDLTKIAPRSKSEVRQRLENLISQAEERGRRRVIEEIKNLIK